MVVALTYYHRLMEGLLMAHWPWLSKQHRHLPNLSETGSSWHEPEPSDHDGSDGLCAGESPDYKLMSDNKFNNIEYTHTGDRQQPA